jgi:hypothetical protein
LPQAAYWVRASLFWLASLLVLGCPLPVSGAGAVWVAGAVPAASAWSGAAAEPAFMRLRTAAAAALAAAVTAEAPTSLGHRGRGGAAGSSRRAAADSSEEILGAMLSCTTCPARSTCGAAQERVLSACRFAAAPALLASGMT